MASAKLEIKGARSAHKVMMLDNDLGQLSKRPGFDFP